MEYVDLGGTMSAVSIVMRRLAISSIIIVALTSFSQEGSVKPATEEGDHRALKSAPKKSGLSADIYEKEDSSFSFTAHVNMIRETDVIEVFFEGKNKGPYLLKEGPNLGLYKERLAKSQKNKTQTVSVKTTDDVITAVEIVEIKKDEKKKSDYDAILDDILKK